MYSMVLMAALTTSSAAPDCHYRSYSCCGGCYGSYSSCYGCTGCCGGCCGGCYGGCYGTSCYGAYYGGCYGLGTSWSGPTYGCTGCYGCTGTVIVMPPEKKMDKTAPPKTDESSGISDRAKVVVELPADAKLFIDDQLMKTTAEKRTFSTPTLAANQTYYYMLRAELMRGGKPIVETKRVLLRAGEVVRADFTAMETVVTVK